MYVLGLGYYLSNSDKSCLQTSLWASNQKIQRHNVLHGVNFVHTDEAHGKVFIERSFVAQQTLHNVFELYSSSHNRCRPVWNLLIFIAWDGKIFL